MNNSVRDREIVFCLAGSWEQQAIEAEGWPPLLRLLQAHGLDPSPYSLPRPGEFRHVSQADAARLTACLEAAYDDVPRDDLWQYYRDEPGGEPDPFTTPPHEWFSGVGVSYLCQLVEFIQGREFLMTLTPVGTEYRFAN